MDRSEVANLFQNHKFREASICFYNGERPVTAVEELTGVSRTTIYKFFSQFKTKWITTDHRKTERYDKDYLKYSGIREKNYFFTQKLLADWISHELNLTRKEGEALTRILEKEPVDNALRKGSESWLEVKTKLMLPLAVLLPLSEMKELGNGFPLQKLSNQINALKGLTRKETREYIQGLQDSIQELEDKKLIDKLMKANLSISLNVNDLRNIIMNIAWSAKNLFLDLINFKELERSGRGKQVINKILKNLGADV